MTRTGKAATDLGASCGSIGLPVSLIGKYLEIGCEKSDALRHGERSRLETEAEWCA